MINEKTIKKIVWGTEKSKFIEDLGESVFLQEIKSFYIFQMILGLELKVYKKIWMKLLQNTVWISNLNRKIYLLSMFLSNFFLFLSYILLKKA